jgi:hypothetical protein
MSCGWHIARYREISSENGVVLIHGEAVQGLKPFEAASNSPLSWPEAFGTLSSYFISYLIYLLIKIYEKEMSTKEVFLKIYAHVIKSGFPKLAAPL